MYKESGERIHSENESATPLNGSDPVSGSIQSPRKEPPAGLVLVVHRFPPPAGRTPTEDSSVQIRRHGGRPRAAGCDPFHFLIVRSRVFSPSYDHLLCFFDDFDFFFFFFWLPQVIEQSVLTVAKAVEDKLDEEIATLEKLDLDDLEALRERRLLQLKKAAERKSRWAALGHGEYTEIVEKDFFAAVKASERVVCHFYRENWPCKVRSSIGEGKNSRAAMR